MSINTPAIPKPAKFYGGDSLYARLESYLHKHGIEQIGDQNYRVTNNLLHRPAGMDMGREQRAYRTLDVKKLSLEGLRRVHACEQKRMDYFMIGPCQLRKVAKEDIEDQVYLGPEQIDMIEAFNNQHRPPMAKFQGLSVPPYFYYDNTFDGMNYHHAWDIAAYHAELVLPERRTGKKQMSEVY